MFIYLVLASQTSEYFNLVIKETTLASLDLISCDKSLQAVNPQQEHLWHVILHHLHCRLWCCHLFPTCLCFQGYISSSSGNLCICVSIMLWGYTQLEAGFFQLLLLPCSSICPFVGMNCRKKEYGDRVS